MSVLEIAIDIGTSYTSIYLSGNGIVLHEPTVVAYMGNSDKRKVRAVGAKAVEMLGKTPERTIVVSPVVDGVIADPGTCAVLLKEFIGRIIPQSYVFRPKIKAILGIPVGLEKKECKTYEDVCFAADISEVTMIENIILSGVGIDMPLASPSAGLVVNIGGGVTEIAALSLCGIVNGCGVSIGGGMMDKALIDYVVGKMNLQIGTNTARKLKHDIGSLFMNDTSKMEVKGVDIRTKKPSSAVVRATDVREALLPYYLRIADAIDNIINKCQPEIAGDIYKSGIYLTGGAAQIIGLPELLSERLKLQVYLVDDPAYAAILGAGKLLSNKELSDNILAQK